MSSVQTVYIQYTQLKRAVNPPRKKNGGGGSGRAGRRSKKADGACRPRLRVCRAVPPGMTVSAPPQCLIAAPRGCAFGRPWAPISAPRRPVCLFWSAARALAGSPQRRRVLFKRKPCRPRACGFALLQAKRCERAALPPARLRVCRAARYAYFGLPPALAAALRRPECLLQPCRPRLRVRRAARYAYFGPAAPPGGARKHPGSWPLITPAACRKA